MLIFLYGEDNYSSREKLAEIKNKFIKYDKSASGLSSFDCEEKADIRDIISAMETANLLAPKRLVIIKNYIAGLSAAEQEKMLDFLKSRTKKIAEEKDLVAVFWESGSPAKNNALFKFLEKYAKKQNFEKLNDAKIRQWILKKIQNINEELSISNAAIDKLMAYAGSELFQLDNEIQKLASFKLRGKIEDEDVDLLVRSATDANIFETIDALSSGNKKRALEMLHIQLEKGEDPFYILSMYVYQFRNLLKIGEYYWQGMTNQYEVAKLAKLHPFVVQKGMRALANYNFDKIRSAYRKLLDIDIASKTGKIDIKLALDKFVAEI
jgi:DNA polymerase-3 subunit delta